MGTLYRYLKVMGTAYRYGWFVPVVDLSNGMSRYALSKVHHLPTNLKRSCLVLSHSADEWLDDDSSGLQVLN